ncbi:retrovirus-related pol polyprotein from transposon TNT 1-94, partial [Tanacetum coccineum]
MFDEYFNPPLSANSPVQVATTPRAVDLDDSPVSTSIDQDAPSTSIPPTKEQEQSPIISQGVEESPKTPYFHDDPLHEDSTSQGSSSNVRPSHTPFELLGKWTKNHPIANVIEDPSCSVSTRKQLQTDAMLKKALYGLKQAPRAWYDMLSSFLLSQEFSKGAVDPILFTRKAGRDILFMSMMGQMTFFLGLQISQCPRGIFINQSNYALEIITKYGMLSSDPVDTPMMDKSKLDKYLEGKPVDPTHYRGMFGSLMHLTSNRPDLYLKDSCITLIAYADADHAGVNDQRVKTQALLEVHNSLGDKTWLIGRPKKKKALLSLIPLYCDNKSAIALCCNNVQHSRSKNIDVRYHSIKEQVENGVMELYFVRTEYQLANIFTKALPRERFNFLIEKLGMKSMSPETLKSLTEKKTSNGSNS